MNAVTDCRILYTDAVAGNFSNRNQMEHYLLRGLEDPRVFYVGDSLFATVNTNALLSNPPVKGHAQAISQRQISVVLLTLNDSTGIDVETGRILKCPSLTTKVCSIASPD